MKSLFSILLKTVSVSLVCALTVVVPATAQSVVDGLTNALSGRHLSVNLGELETIAGSKEALAEGLLEIRHLERPPFVGIRAQKFLMQLTEIPSVQQALEDDVSSEQYFGLARVVVSHLDSIPQADVRGRIARAALSRAQREAKFAPFARMLLESKDAEVKRLARDSFGEN